MVKEIEEAIKKDIVTEKDLKNINYRKPYFNGQLMMNSYISNIETEIDFQRKFFKLCN